MERKAHPADPSLCTTPRVVHVSVTDSARGEICISAMGRGSPIIIVHGSGSSIDDWTDAQRILCERHRVILVERRLYARDGDAAIATHSIAREVEDLAAVLDWTGPPAVLVGHSAGAVVCLEFALKYPGRVAKLIAYEPPVPVGQPLGGGDLAAAEATYRAGHANRAASLLLRKIVRAPAYLFWLVRFSPIWPEVVRSLPAQLAEIRAIDDLGVEIARYRRLNMPVLLIGGSKSPAHFGARIDALSLVIPDADRITLPGLSHFPGADLQKAIADLCETWRGLSSRTASPNPCVVAPHLE